tara:strand:- start:138 stop:320 length:183 start_codon:yes stop_codon:yes gene_type:complete
MFSPKGGLVGENFCSIEENKVSSVKNVESRNRHMDVGVKFINGDENLEEHSYTVSDAPVD